MQACRFDHVLKCLDTLTRRQRDRLIALLRPAAKRDQSIVLIVQTVVGLLACSACSSSKLYRHGHGHARGLQCDRCRHCGLTWDALTGTPVARLRHKRHKQHWRGYPAHMLDSRSARCFALELGVASSTRFRRRHRFLPLAKETRRHAWPGLPKPMRCMFLSLARVRASWIGTTQARRQSDKTRDLK